MSKIHNSIITKLDKMIPYTPFKKAGQYNGYSIILIGGSSYSLSSFDYFKKNKFIKQFRTDTNHPNINFQKNLSKHTQTFSFVRPTDLLNLKLYSNYKPKKIYITSKQDLTIKSYGKFIYDLLNYHKVKPPYVFVVFSEGGYDVMCFSKYYEKLINSVYFIDTPFLEKYMFEFEKYRNNTKWLKNVLKNKFMWDHSKEISKEQLVYIDGYNFEIKTLNIISKLKISNLPKNKKFFILWSPYYDTPNQIDKKKVEIQTLQNKKLPNNCTALWLKAPHQIERTIPNFLIEFILNSLFI